MLIIILIWKEVVNMKKAMFNVWAKSQIAKQTVKDKSAAVRNAFLEEDGGPEAIIIAIIMIIIVVALAIVFREQIGNWVNDLFQAGEDQINNAASGGTNASAI